MKKLSLSLEQLKVESYTTDSGDEERGTVQAHSLPTLPLCTRIGCQTGYCNTATCTVDLCC